MDLTAQPKSSVPSAAFRALAAWLLIYAVVSQLLVISKWKSSSTVAQQEVVVVETGEIAPDAKLLQQRKQEEAIQPIHKLINELNQEKSRQQVVVASTEEQLKLLRNSVFRPMSRGDESPRPTGFPPNLTFLKQLLELSSLSDVPSNALRQLSKAMRNQVDAVAAANATVEWSTVADLVAARYERRDEPARKCPPKPIDSELARESQFHQKFHQVEALIQRRAKTVPPLLNKDSILQSLQEQASHPPPLVETIDSDRMCASQQDVISMMDEGLDALQRRLDLRRVLKKYLLSNYREIDESELILDAVLDPPSQPLQEKKTVNLRHVLDTPLLKESSKWIDGIVDMLGGYSDVFDQFVDKSAANDSSVGQSLISKIQTLAGKVELPNVLSKVPSKAGILRQG